MNKQIELFGRKIPVIAIVIAVLVIGTASATVYQHYATVEGNVMILSPITVTVDGHLIPLGGNHNYTIESMTSPCTIIETLTFNNSYGSALDVELLWVLYESEAPLPLDANTSYWIWDNETYSVPNGISNHDVSLTVPAYMMGSHIFAIAVNPVI